MPKRIFITGASSGIGFALAHEYAARGFDLILTARRIDTLKSLRQEIIARHPERTVHAMALDVTRVDDVFASLAFDALAAANIGTIDIVVANSGIGSLGRVGHGDFGEQRKIIETNVIGAMATCDAAIRLFKQQGFGQLVVMSSVAAFRGLPRSSAYGASKAAIATYAEAIRAEIYGTAVKVTTIFPGYIDTPINRGVPSRPFVITVERGAKLIADKIDRGVATAVVPAFPWTLVKWIARFIPTRLIARR
ncbi:MAG TPA: SDR family oxidoreductase [Steroidobacteraceae bacterium]|nr:SDR family oxidoreductase [Steroidobacteraceae bacterium]